MDRVLGRVGNGYRLCILRVLVLAACNKEEKERCMEPYKEEKGQKVHISEQK